MSCRVQGSRSPQGSLIQEAGYFPNIRPPPCQRPSHFTAGMPFGITTTHVPRHMWRCNSWYVHPILAVLPPRRVRLLPVFIPQMPVRTRLELTGPWEKKFIFDAACVVKGQMMLIRSIYYSVMGFGFQYKGFFFFWSLSTFARNGLS